VRTKFEQHLQGGKLIVSEILQIIDSMCDRAQQLKTQKAVAKKAICDKLNFTEKQLPLLTQEIQDKVQQIYKDFREKVSCFRGTCVNCTEGTE
jgi:mitofusin